MARRISQTSTSARLREVAYQPWKATQCNVVDAIVTFGMIIFVSCGALLISPDEKNKDTLQSARRPPQSSLVCVIRCRSILEDFHFRHFK